MKFCRFDFINIAFCSCDLGFACSSTALEPEKFLAKIFESQMLIVLGSQLKELKLLGKSKPQI